MYFYIVLREKLTYRWELFTRVIGSLMYIALNILLWSFLFQNNEEMTKYMVNYTIISNILSTVYVNDISGNISRKITTGDFVLDLLRPKNFFFLAWQQQIASVCINLAIKGIPIIIVYFPLLMLDASYTNLGVFILAIILGHILYTLIYSFIGFLAFIFIETWTLSRFIDDTIKLVGGSFIPLAFLPTPIQKIANILPFRYLFDFPIKTLLESKTNTEPIDYFRNLIIWIAIFSLFNYGIYNIALKRAVVQGG